MTEAEVERICRQYQRFVRYIIAQKFPVFANDEDIYQEGMIELFKATRTFDPNQGCTFMTYAGKCVWQRIMNVIQKSNRRCQHKFKTISLNSAEHDLLTSIPDEYDIEDKLLEDALMAEIFDACKDEMDIDIITYRLSGLNQGQIAGKLLLTQSMVSRRIRRIKKVFYERRQKNDNERNPSKRGKQALAGERYRDAMRGWRADSN